jgi:hypothetical protein
MNSRIDGRWIESVSFDLVVISGHADHDSGPTSSYLNIVFGGRVLMSPSLAIVTAEVICPVVQVMLSDDEVSGMAVKYVTRKGGWGDLETFIILELAVPNSEILNLSLGSDHDLAASLEDRRRRFASDLQDAIAESAFAWGQLRSTDFLDRS